MIALSPFHSFECKEFLSGKPNQKVKVLVELSSPMLASLAPDLGWKARRRDAVKDTGDGSSCESLISVVENKGTNVGPDGRLLAVRNLYRIRSPRRTDFRQWSRFFKVIFDETAKFVAPRMVHRITA